MVTDLDLFGPSLPAWPACQTCQARTGERHRDTCPRASVWAHFDSRRDMHEVSEQCKNMHCEWHGVDEPGPGYLACGECFHLYPTARALRRAYRRGAFCLYWTDLRNSNRFLITDRIWAAEMKIKIPAFPRLRLVWAIMRLPFVRADKILFCQFCIHDF